MQTSGCKNNGGENTKKFVKHLSTCKFYKKNGNTADSTENAVESSVFQSRNFYIKDHLHHFTYAMKLYMPEKWTSGTR
jgi:hypothetical protein